MCSQPQTRVHSDSLTDSRTVMEKMSVKRIDAVILDLCMPHLTGIDLLPLLRENYPQLGKGVAEPGI